MENIIPIDMISEILSFLELKDIINYDSALTSHKLRAIFLNVIKNIKIYKICKWAFIRNVKIKNGICCYKNIKYIPNMCENITICKSYGCICCKYKFGTSYVNIKNDNIKYLHIDLCRNKNIIFESLMASNLEKLTIVYVDKINIFTNLLKNCPKLDTLIIIESNIENLELDNFKNSKINIKILKTCRKPYF